MVVAIDGPAGAGKSTVARALARELGFTYLDSGSMYRAVGLLTLRNGGAASDQAEGLELSLGDRVIANGEDVTEAIRAPEVSEASPVRAPDRSLSELADRLVETGIPWSSPAPVLAMAWATDSWLMSIW